MSIFVQNLNFMNIFEALKRYFGYDSFRENQEAIIQHVTAGNDAHPTSSSATRCSMPWPPSNQLLWSSLETSPELASISDRSMASASWN